MNAKQIKLTCIIAAAIMFTVLFPPYGMNIASYQGAGEHYDFGYAFIGTLPKKRDIPAKVNFPALTAQIVCFLILGGMLWVEFRGE